MTRILGVLLALAALIVVDLALLHQSQAVAAWGVVLGVLAGWMMGRKCQ